MSEPLVWESMTIAYTRWISDRRYRVLRPAYQRWYRPICPNCGPAKAIEAQRAETVKPGSVHESAVPKGFAQLPSDEGGE